jgi:hypothetical protein
MAPTPRLATEQSDRDAGGAQEEVQDPRAEFQRCGYVGVRT